MPLRVTIYAGLVAGLTGVLCITIAQRVTFTTLPFGAYDTNAIQVPADGLWCDMNEVRLLALCPCGMHHVMCHALCPAT
jgi:hypothetical protein